MLLSEYQATLAEIIGRYGRTDLIVASELNADARTPKSGVIRGVITFFDGSQLFLMSIWIPAIAWKSLLIPITIKMWKAT